MSKNHARNTILRFSRSFVSDGSRFPLLDLVRIVAALSVFVYHFGIGSKHQDPWQTFKFGSLTPSWGDNQFLSIWSQYGYLGVDVFFFLSGFVITRTMTGKGPNEFLLARFKRLFLPYFLVLIPTFIVYYFFSIRPPLTESSILDVAFSAQWKGLQPIIAASWTLVYEINFYLIVFIFMAVREILKKLGIDFRPHIFFIGLLLLSSVSKLDQFPTPFNMLFLGGYSILFVGGALTYLIISNAFKMNLILKFWLVLLLTAQIVIHLKARVPNDQNATRISIVIVSSIFLVIVITGFLKDKFLKSAVLGNLSFLTYTFYLLHQQVGLAIATLLVSRLGMSAELVLFLIVFVIFVFSFLIESLSSKIWNLSLKNT